MGRRSRRLLAGGIVVAAALLLGRGLGLLPSPSGRVDDAAPPSGPPQPGQDQPQQTPPSQPPPAGRPQAKATPPGPPPADGAPAGDRGAANDGGRRSGSGQAGEAGGNEAGGNAAGGHEPAGSAPPPPPEAAPPATPLPDGAGIDADNLQSALAAAPAALASGHLGAGLAALDALDGPALSAPQRQRVDAARAELQAAVATATDQLAGELQQGLVLAARARLRALLDPPHPQVEAALRQLAAAHGWPDLTREGRPAGELPAPAPLPRDRLVRTRRQGSELQARVVDATRAEVTLRVVEGAGVTFPSLPVVAVEPVRPTAAEAAECGLAAAAAGDGRLARLWLCCALAAGEAVPERAEPLRKLFDAGR